MIAAMSENQPAVPANGAHTTNGRPNGVSSITPFIAVADARAAIDFYRDVFGARIIEATEMNGVVAHAELAFENGHLQVGEANAAYHLVPQPAGDDVSASFAIYCPDVDGVVRRALEAGAALREPVTDFVSGDRYGSVRDPFGVRWSIMTRIEDLSEEESSARVRAWAASMMQAPETTPAPEASPAPEAD
jgi:PhnB protein